MPGRKIALIIVACVVVVVGPIVYVWLFGFQTMMALEVRYLYRKSPEAWQTPVEIPDASISSTSHKKISYFGYELELPWDDVDDQKSRTVGSFRVTAFSSGNVVSFSASPPRDFVDTVIRGTKMDRDSFAWVFGEEAARSDYFFHRELLQATPSSVSPFMSRRDASRGSELLLLKAITMPASDSGIFEIQTPHFRGFQFEGSRGRALVVRDDLYAEDGGLELNFIQRGAGSAPVLSQPEINRVLQSIHKVSVATAAPAAHPPQ